MNKAYKQKLKIHFSSGKHIICWRYYTVEYDFRHRGVMYYNNNCRDKRIYINDKHIVLEVPLTEVITFYYNKGID